MELSKKERLFLSLQLQILEKIDPENAHFHEAHRTAVERGYALHYDWLAEHIDDGLSIEECRFVLDVLDMYRAITYSFMRLPDKSAIEKSATEFPGFDGNNEPAYLSYTNYFVFDLGRYGELHESKENVEFNSHCPMIDHYRKMLGKWEAMGKKQELSIEDLKELLED